VQTMPVWKGGFGGLDIWLRGDIVGTQCGQYTIASLLALREHPLADRRTVDEEAIKNLVSVGWAAQAAEAARDSCPRASRAHTLRGHEPGDGEHWLAVGDPPTEARWLVVPQSRSRS